MINIQKSQQKKTLEIMNKHGAFLNIFYLKKTSDHSNAIEPFKYHRTVSGDPSTLTFSNTDFNFFSHCSSQHWTRK